MNSGSKAPAATGGNSFKFIERLNKLEAEIRILCDRIKGEIELRSFKRLLINELRQNGFIVSDKWEQRQKTIDFLAWKHGLAIAIQIRQGEDFILPMIDDLKMIVHEQSPERHVMRVIINLEGQTITEDLNQAMDHGIIWIQPGQMTPSAVNLAEITAKSAAGSPDLPDLPF